LDNPDSDKFYTLPKAFNVLGRERYGEEWTGVELRARNRPPPERPPPRTFHIERVIGLPGEVVQMVPKASA